MVLALLREDRLRPFPPRRVRAVYHPLGSGGVKRHAEAFRTVRSVWHQGRHPETPQLGNHGDRAGVVPLEVTA